MLNYRKMKLGSFQSNSMCLKIIRTPSLYWYKMIMLTTSRQCILLQIYMKGMNFMKNVHQFR